MKIAKTSYLLVAALIILTSLSVVTVSAEGDMMSDMMSKMTESIMPNLESAGRSMTSDEDNATDEKDSTDSDLDSVDTIGALPDADENSNDKDSNDENSNEDSDASASAINPFAGADGIGGMDGIMDKMSKELGNATKESGNDMDKINKVLSVFSMAMAMAMMMSVMKMVTGRMFGKSGAAGESATDQLGLNNILGGSDKGSGAADDSGDNAAASESAASEAAPADDGTAALPVDDGLPSTQDAGDANLPEDTGNEFNDQLPDDYGNEGLPQEFESPVLKVQDAIEALPYKGSGDKATEASPFITLADIINEKKDSGSKITADSIISEMDNQVMDFSGSLAFIRTGSNWSEIKSIFGKHFPDSADAINSALDELKSKAEAAEKSNEIDPDADLPDNYADESQDSMPAVNAASIGDTPDVTSTDTPELPGV